MLKQQLDIAFLSSALPFWRALDSSQQKAISDATLRYNVKAGESVRVSDKDCLGLAIIKDGQLRAYILSESGKEITLYRLLEYDICIFTASCIMKNINFHIHIEAEQDSVLYLIPTFLFEQMKMNSLAVSDFTNELMSSRFSDVMWLMEQILFMSFDKRLALFLINQSTISGSDDIEMTQEVIARHLGSAREVVTRMLKYFQNEQLVRVYRGGVAITNKKRLENLAYST